MNVLAYVESVSPTTAIEGLHYCLRALEHVGEPHARERDFFFDAPSSMPGPESRALTMAILSGIERAEQTAIHDLDRETIMNYVGTICDAGDALSYRILDTSPPSTAPCTRQSSAKP